MADTKFVERLRAVLEQEGRRPTRERWDELVSRGSIDADGKVLVRGPEAPEAPAKRGRKRAR